MSGAGHVGAGWAVEPNNSNDEDCGHLLRYYPDYTWNDIRWEAYHIPFVCEPP